MHTYRPANSISDGPVTNPLSILRILIEFLSRAHAKGRKSQNDFKFDTFIGRFPSDRAASMAVKGLDLNVFNAKLSPKRYWRGPRSQEAREEGDCT